MRKSAFKWSQVKQQIKTWDTTQLTGLVHELFELSPENRLFLETRFTAGQADGEANESLRVYRKQIDQLFYKRSGWPVDNLKLGDGRKIVNAYQKASGDAAGVLELTLHFVETGTCFTVEFGDIDEAFYLSIERMLDHFGQLLRSPANRHLFPRFKERLDIIQKAASRIGWGFGDEVNDIIETLRLDLTTENARKVR